MCNRNGLYSLCPVHTYSLLAWLLHSSDRSSNGVTVLPLNPSPLYPYLRLHLLLTPTAGILQIRNSPVREHFSQRRSFLNNGHHMLLRKQLNFRQFTYRAFGEIVVNDFVKCCCISMEGETCVCANDQ